MSYLKLDTIRYVDQQQKHGPELMRNSLFKIAIDRHVIVFVAADSAFGRIHVVEIVLVVEYIIGVDVGA